MLSQKESFNMNLRRSKRKCRSKYSFVAADHSTSLTLQEDTFSFLENLSSDCLEQIALRLDTKSALALFRSCKRIHMKLSACVHFWKHLCINEAFQEFSALKKDNNSK